MTPARRGPDGPTVADSATVPRRVVFVFAGCEVMDVAGPLQAFYEAAAFGERYELLFCGTTRAVRSAQGLAFDAIEPLPVVGSGDRVIVPGFPLADRPPAKLVAWLRRAHHHGAEICSVCTGAFVLGEAGLLDGRRCTTHWRRLPELQARFPRARVVGDRLFVEDEGVVTSAGIAAGIDMTLGLLERDGGPVLASAVAREMVVYLRRDGAHHQQSVYLDFQTHLHPGIHRVQQHLVTRPAADGSLRELAVVAGMSERHLTRVFKQATGISINDYRTRLRLERARALLRNPSLTLEAIASASGFAGARQLRRSWRQWRGTSLAEARRTAVLAFAETHAVAASHR